MTENRFSVELDLPHGHISAEGEAQGFSAIMRALLPLLDDDAKTPVVTRRRRTTAPTRNPDSALQRQLKEWLLRVLPTSQEEARDIVSLAAVAPQSASRASVNDALVFLMDEGKVTRVRVGASFRYYLTTKERQTTVDDFTDNGNSRDGFAATVVAGEGVTKGSV